MRKQVYLWLGILIALSLALSLVSGSCSTAPTTSNPGLNSTAESSPTGNGPQEGVKVHGHWLIEVTNPDGTLAQHLEFENALVTGANTSGAAALPRLLGRQTNTGRWYIYLDSTSTPAFFSAPGTNAPGKIAESTETATGPNIFKTLTLTVGANLVLNGTAVAQANGNIETVETKFLELKSGADPALCDFTKATLETPVTITAGQQVAVTVTLSFS